MTRNRRNATATGGYGLATIVGGFLILATASGSGALPSPRVGISKSASLQELYAFLQVPPPQADIWGPPRLPEECSKDWVVWSDGAGDPLPVPALQICRGRWRAENRDRCRSYDRCGCDQYRQCVSGRTVRDTCDQANNCLQVMFQKNVSDSQRIGERDHCRAETSDAARESAE